MFASGVNKPRPPRHVADRHARALSKRTKPKVLCFTKGNRLHYPTRLGYYCLLYSTECRCGRPLIDAVSGQHIFSPYYFTGRGVLCACRLCEPSLWIIRPLVSCPFRRLHRAAFPASVVLYWQQKEAEAHRP